MKNSKSERSKSLIKTKTHEVKIMKMLKRKPPGLHKKAIGIAAGFFLLAIFMPGSASATTAANAVITNTATVNYDDAGGNAQVAVQDSVDVTVNLVTAHPTFNAPTPVDLTTPSGISVDYTYTITNNSNGLDTYNLTSGTSVVGANITLGTIVFRDAGDTGDITSIDLGASSVAVAALTGATVITVPNDGAGGGDVNGIGAGDTVVIGGNSYLVDSVVDNATGTSTITLDAGTPLVADIFVGDQIGEQGTFILRTGTATTTVSGETYTITVTADDGVTAGAAPTDDTITTVTLINLSVVKYVANITTGVAGGGATVGPFTTGLGTANVTYYESGVTANPGDILEYVIAVTNAAGSGTATDIIISDPVPAFTAQIGNIALDPAGAAAWSNVATTADNGDFAEADATTVYIFAGTGGDDTTAGLGNGTGGSLAASTTTYGAFRVQVTP